MDIIQERNRIKQEIDKISDPDILSRINDFLFPESGSLMNEEQLAMVKESREEYLKNPSSAIMLDEFRENIKSKHGF